MKYLSVCSGIEAATCAWHHMGWKPEAFSEIEPFPSAVLAHHYPDTPNLGDMTKYKEWNLGAIDLLVGGTPCQSFSVAGLRKGLDDPRGNLMLTFGSIARHFSPRWLVWENVPGVLSSNGGRDFGSFLGMLGELGYGFAYRVLDAQYFGVAQRRRRVFVVGHLGDWRPAAAVLFESSSLSGNPKPSREKGERVAPTVVQGPPFSRTGNQRVECEAIVPTLANCLQTTCNDYSRADGFNMIAQPIPLDSMAFGRDGDKDTRYGLGVGEPGQPSFTLTKAQSHAVAQPISIQGNLIGREAGGPQGVGASDEGVMYTLTKADVHGVAQPISYGIRTANTSSNGWGIQEEVTHTLDRTQGLAVAQPMAVHENQRSELTLNETIGTVTCSGGKPEQGYPAVMQPTIIHGTQDPCVSDIAFAQGRNSGGENVMVQSMAVRRLTPRECERLQGFRDDYTLIPWRGKEAPDGPRYKALGNSMAVPVMRWIGERIESLRLLQR